jgi:hypothetical protein
MASGERGAAARSGALGSQWVGAVHAVPGGLGSEAADARMADLPRMTFSFPIHGRLVRRCSVTAALPAAASLWEATLPSSTAVLHHLSDNCARHEDRRDHHGL